MTKLNKILPRPSLLKGWLLSIFLLIPSLLSAYDFKVDGIYYNILSSTQKTVSVTYRYSSGDSYSGAVSIPSEVTYNNASYSVTSIGEDAFYNCSGLTSVTIPNSVTSIGNYAFNSCSGLTSVTIPNSVTSIGYSAFCDCSSLTSVTIPNSVTSIGDYAFCDCSSLTSVTIPNSVTSIGYSAFCDCSSLTSVTIPNSVTSIGDYAFYNCSGLTSVTIPNSVTSIGSYAFSNCSGMSSVTIPNSVTSIGNSAFWSCSGLTSLTISNSVTSIGDYTFYKCSGLTSVTIPNSVTSIGNSAFSYCTGLTSVTIPNSVTSIGNYAFSGCSDLIKSAYPNTFSNPFSYGVSVAYNPQTDSIEDGFIYGPGKASIVFAPLSLPEDYAIPNTVTSIGNYAFYACAGPKSITIPNSITSIGSYAFSSFANLQSLTLGTGILSIGTDAFSDSYGNPYLIRKVFWLGNTPPSGINEIKAQINYVSNDTYSLSNQIKYQFLSSMFVVNGTRYVPVSPSERTCDVVDSDYGMSDGNVVIADKVMNRGIELSVLNINKYAFAYNNSITSLSVSPKGNVGEYAFYMCPNLTSLTVENTGNIGEYAFQRCEALTSAVVNNSGDIARYAFSGCSALKELAISSKGNIGESAFSNCTALETVSVDNAGKIGFSAFSFNSNLKTVTIGDVVTALENSAFAYNYNLTNVVFGNSVTTLGNNVFDNCISLSSITLPDHITTIGESVFSDCTALTTVTLGRGITAIPNYTFKNCAALCNLTIPNNVKSIGNYVFMGCKSLKNLTIEDGKANESVAENASLSLTVGSNGTNPLFQGCPLDNVYIGRRLSYTATSAAGYSPFYRNTTLRSVEITDAETKIYDNEFYGCSNLKSLKIGDGVTTIGKWAFSGCSALEYFSAGYNVQSIGDEAFSDCTGLKEYHSYSIVPPVCGNQSLDDINKWDCTLHVPAESSDEYMAANQWKDFFFVTENGAVLVESIRLNTAGLDMKTGDSFQMEAEVIPANATHPQITWSSSDATVATVDDKGMVSFLKEGFATITAHATDGSGVESSVDVVVTVKNPELGDSNANGVVNVADAVNTANYAIGKSVEHFNATAADVNLDGFITLADASATISLILNQADSTPAMAKVKASATTNDDADMLVIDDYSAKVGETVSVAVALDNTRLYTALQGDVTVPEGMTLEAVNIGSRAKGTHSLAVKRIDARTVRMVLFDVNNSAFADSNEAVVELIVKANEAIAGQIEISNIVASDAQAREYEMISAGGENTEMATIDGIASGNIRIANTADGIQVYNARGREVVVCAADGTVLRRFTATSDIENLEMMSGLYVVTAGSMTKKVIIK